MNHLRYCPACGTWHGRRWVCTDPPADPHAILTAMTPNRIPDDDWSVCTLHPERTRIARRLLAFLDTTEEHPR